MSYEPRSQYQFMHLREIVHGNARVIWDLGWRLPGGGVTTNRDEALRAAETIDQIIRESKPAPAVTRGAW